jgi:hypothetical protein
MSSDRIDGIALAAGWTVRGVNPSNNGLFSLPKKFQTGFGIHPVSYSTDTEFLPRNKMSGCEVDHSYLCSAEVEDRWS